VANLGATPKNNGRVTPNFRTPIFIFIFFTKSNSQSMFALKVVPKSGTA